MLILCLIAICLIIKTLINCLFFFRLKHKDVFTLIQKHNLNVVIYDMLIELMDLDYKKTITLLLDQHIIPTDDIVEKLKQNELHLYQVLLSTHF